MPTPRIPEPEIVIGAFYEVPDGRVCKTYGWSGRTRLVSYYFDDDKGGHQIAVADCASWTARRDLNDFPNARDPRLPYEFDLLWDIKTRSQLVEALKIGDDEAGLRRAMADHHVELSEAEISAINAARDGSPGPHM